MLLGALSQVERWGAGKWSQPKLRLAVIGVVLVLLGAVLLPSSVWTLPLTILGALLLLIASVGSRLDGRFTLEWGEQGTQIEFRAAVHAPVARPAPGLRLAPVPSDEPELIEGEAHTVEIDVGELKALIAEAEADGLRGTVRRSG